MTGIDVKRKLHIDLLSASLRLTSPRDRQACQEALPGARFSTGLIVLIAFSAASSRYLNASRVEATHSQKAEAATRTAYAWIAPAAHSQNSLGTLTVAGQDHGTGIQLLAPSIHSKAGVLVCNDARWDDSGRQLKITYAAGRLLVHVTISLAANPDAFEATVDADLPVVNAVDMGVWAPALQAEPISVPYYSGSVWRLPRMGAYGNAWWDWHTTHATKLSGTQAQYFERTDTTLSALHERLFVILSPDVDAALPAPGNQASPYMAELSGRMVLDIWTPDFKHIEQGLLELGDYGITDCVGIIHVWQHAGYDNALPQHYPANEALGGDGGLTAAVRAGKKDGCLMAVHENYVDYYPNYPGFNPAAIALDGDGKRMLAWLNHSTGVQSYWTKPVWMTANARTQSPAIHERYGTTAAYLDVNSAISPFSHVDMDARATGAGMLATLLAGNTILWSYERKTHGGPVFGEGAHHWYYSGLLDGVEAQFGAGDVRENQGTQAPLFVDFDLKRIHPLQMNHGMGYYERWVLPGESVSNTLTMDAYRMQEIAFGHAPFLGGVYWDDVAHALVESNLVSPVARSYGAASVSSIEYQVNGSWESPSLAAESGAFSRVRVTYGNGLMVVANASRQPLRWQNVVLPQYGWAAKAQGLFAYTALCGATVCDYAETGTSVFANARSQVDFRIGRAFTTPSVASVSQTGNRSFAIAFAWQVHRPMNNDYKTFVHFVDQNQLKVKEGIAFQGDSSPDQRTSQWGAGTVVSEAPRRIQIPASVADGTYSIRMGLYDPKTGSRVPLAGVDDGDMRSIVGSLTVSGNGTHIGFETIPVANDPRLNWAGTVVSFGAVQTDGMIYIREDHGRWVLRPYPRSRDFTVLLQNSRFAMPASITADGGSSPLLKPVAEGAYWKLPLSRAKSYSWPVVRQ
jgi:Family of unknown function (DUF5696)